MVSPIAECVPKVHGKMRNASNCHSRNHLILLCHFILFLRDLQVREREILKKKEKFRSVLRILFVRVLCFAVFVYLFQFFLKLPFTIVQDPVDPISHALHGTEFEINHTFMVIVDDIDTHILIFGLISMKPQRPHHTNVQGVRDRAPSLRPKQHALPIKPIFTRDFRQVGMALDTRWVHIPTIVTFPL